MELPAFPAIVRNPELSISSVYHRSPFGVAHNNEPSAGK